jgi:hypothetical protein
MIKILNRNVEQLKKLESDGHNSCQLLLRILLVQNCEH